MDDIRKYQRTALRYRNEAFTSAFAERIVNSTNKTANRNYLVIREFPVRAAGITQAMRSSDIVIIEVIEQHGDVDRVVLIIECKVNDSDVRKALAQLTGYMRDVNCRDGIAMSANLAIIYRDFDEQFPEQIGDVLDLSVVDNITILMQHIDSL